MNRSYEPDADRQLSEPGTHYRPVTLEDATDLLLASIRSGIPPLAAWWARVVMRKARTVGLWKDDIEKQRAA